VSKNVNCILVAKRAELISIETSNNEKPQSEK